MSIELAEWGRHPGDITGSYCETATYDRLPDWRDSGIDFPSGKAGSYNCRLHVQLRFTLIVTVHFVLHLVTHPT